LRVKDNLGAEIERLALDYGTPIFPGESKTYSAKSDRSWLPGSYAVQLMVIYGDAWAKSLTMTKDFRLDIADDGSRLEETQGVP
jgi:hypothetical protein